MKPAFIIVVLLSILPLTLLLRRYEWIARLFWVCFGAGAFFLASVPLFDIGLISWGDRWIGFVYGVELSVIDFLAILAFFTLPRRRTLRSSASGNSCACSSSRPSLRGPVFQPR